MPNNYRMSYFMPPIAPIKDKQGRLMTPPTLIPFCEVSIEQVFQMITCNENLKALTEQVRNSEDIRTAKASLLPYVTPCGTFTRRSSKDFVSPSHLVIVLSLIHISVAFAAGVSTFVAGFGAAGASSFGFRGGKFNSIMLFCGQTSTHFRQDLHLFGSM